jgi:erythromycin esterase-like protein
MADLARIIRDVRLAARPLVGGGDDLDPVVQAAGGARLVLLGEASHGTHEFYRLRAEITRRLITEQGFHAVAVEADWPDAHRVNRFVRGQAGDHPRGRSDDRQAARALDGFRRFPTWMWRNADVLDLVGWLRDRNRQHPAEDGVGFYGLDLYSLQASIGEVIGYLARIDPGAADRARRRYACFDHFGPDSDTYARAMFAGLGESCEDQVVAQLVEFQRRAAVLRSEDERQAGTRDGVRADDELFHARQNARVALNAERYYRTMFRGRVSSWNLRDTHMADTLEQLLAHLDARVGRARVIVWAHNSHLGDARATELGAMGELNVGQLVRTRHAGDCLLVGFTTFGGTVTAASDWDAPAERKRVNPALPDSCEALFHSTGIPAFLLDLRPPTPARAALREPRLQRAIGVVYRPDTERQSHYFHARLADQFDLVLHLDHTRAVEPLETIAPPTDEVAETFPTGV